MRIFCTSRNRSSGTAGRQRLGVFLLAGLLIVCLAPAAAHAGGLKPGRLGLDQARGMQVSPQDRCPVCGMKVIRYPKFSSAIQLANGDTYYFCSNGCMLKAWLHPEIFLKATRQALSLAVVREYFTGRQVSARDVTWIAGSDVIGPMGPAMVAVQGKTAVETFVRRHGGQRHFRLSELTDDLWFALTGKPAKDP